jgi:hypothetical protein
VNEQHEQRRHPHRQEHEDDLDRSLTRWQFENRRHLQAFVGMCVRMEVNDRLNRTRDDNDSCAQEQTLFTDFQPIRD